MIMIVHHHNAKTAALQSVYIRLYGGTLPDSPPHHLSVGTINTNGINKMKLEQLLFLMGIQKIDVLCLTDTRLSKKVSKAYGIEKIWGITLQSVLVAIFRAF